MMNLASGAPSALVLEGKLNADVYVAATIPLRPRLLQEFTAPLQAGELPDPALEERVIAETANAATLRW